MTCELIKFLANGRIYRKIILFLFFEISCQFAEFEESVNKITFLVLKIVCTKSFLDDFELDSFLVGPAYGALVEYDFVLNGFLDGPAYGLLVEYDLCDGLVITSIDLLLEYSRNSLLSAQLEPAFGVSGIS